MKKFVIVIAAILFHFNVEAQTPDIIITNARIMDGTGNSWFHGEIWISKGIITNVFKIPGKSYFDNKGINGNNTTRVIDAANNILAPGFIDVHAHIETGIFERPTAENYIYDGVTTVVTGNCGNSFDDIGDFFRKIDSMKTSINIATLVGHNTIRRLGMGLENRKATEPELIKMKSLVEKAMNDGAVGISTGLIYLPGMYSTTEEIVDLSKVAASRGGVYATHMRNEGLRVVQAINEALEVGVKANIPVQISHFKVAAKANWGRSTETLDLIKQARINGYDVTIDQYPYTASSTNLAVLVPDWAMSGGLDSLRTRIKNQKIREQIKKDMARSAEAGKNKSYSYAVVASYGPDTTLNGKSISQINIEKGRKKKFKYETETVLGMLEKANAQMVYHTMNEEDVQYFMKYPFNMPAADAGVSNGKGMPHPRTYGTNARILGKYVRDLKLIGWEEAIRRMTSLPAQKFNLKDRGMIREGMAADLVIIEEDKVTDLSTFEIPHQYSKGIPYVIVNGQIIVENGNHTQKKSGKILKNPNAL